MKPTGDFLPIEEIGLLNLTYSALGRGFRCIASRRASVGQINRNDSEHYENRGLLKMSGCLLENARQVFVIIQLAFTNLYFII